MKEGYEFNAQTNSRIKMENGFFRGHYELSEFPHPKEGLMPRPFR